MIVMIGVRGWWGILFSYDKGVIKGVKKMMVVMVLIEVVNFLLIVSGGIVRGIARLWFGMYVSLGGFYFLVLSLGVVLVFKVGFGFRGLFLGFMVGVVICLVLLLVFIVRINWVKEVGRV